MDGNNSSNTMVAGHTGESASQNALLLELQNVSSFDEGKRLFLSVVGNKEAEVLAMERWLTFVTTLDQAKAVMVAHNELPDPEQEALQHYKDCNPAEEYPAIECEDTTLKPCEDAMNLARKKLEELVLSHAAVVEEAIERAVTVEEAKAALDVAPNEHLAEKALAKLEETVLRRIQLASTMEEAVAAFSVIPSGSLSRQNMSSTLVEKLLSMLT